jgi:flagellar hook protein FlgE
MSSFFSALSALRAHQDWLDVIGNNLANTNTNGFRTGQARFSDQFSTTLRYASAPGTSFGGVDPMQVGGGVRLSDIGRSFQQGALQSTGKPLDVALQGGGFFAIANGSHTYYTRVGTFGLDGAHNLVDQRTGFNVLDRGGARITVDTDAIYPPQATTLVSLAGNLPSHVSGPLPQILTGVGGLRDGDPATITGTVAEPFPIPLGQTWSMTISASGGAEQQVSIPGATGGVSAATVAAAIDALDGVAATVDGSGHVVVSTERTGEAVSLKVTAGQTGQDLASALGLSTTLVMGTQTPVSAATDLNDLPGNVTHYQAGDTIRVRGFDGDGTQIDATFTYGAGNDGTTVNDFVSFLDATYGTANVSLDAQGRIVAQAVPGGVSNLSMLITDGTGSTGRTLWTTYALSTTQAGTAADVVSTTAEVYDQAGLAHAVTVDFARQDDGSWTATPTIAATEGTIISAPITGITFGPDGAPTSLAGLDTSVTVMFAGSPAPQTFALDLGSNGAFSGVTQLGAIGDVVVRQQDGFAFGTLDSLTVDADGTIRGNYSNGHNRALAQMGIATFANDEGLAQVGDSAFAVTANSGTANMGAGNVGHAGRVVGGSLEGSNVDTAEQFVMLIEAQRGFQANSRVITAQDEVLKDLVNLI